MSTSERLLLLLFVVFIGTAASNDSPENSCEDLDHLCSSWKNNSGCINETSDCRTWISYCNSSSDTRKKCPKSCNTCEARSEKDSCSDPNLSCSTNWKNSCGTQSVRDQCPCNCKTCNAENAGPESSCEDGGRCSSSCEPDEEHLIGYNSAKKSLYCCKKNAAVNGGWSGWSLWSTCRSDCRHTRQRSCDNPTPQFHGTTCKGKRADSGSCTGGNCKDLIEGRSPKSVQTTSHKVIGTTSSPTGLGNAGSAHISKESACKESQTYTVILSVVAVLLIAIAIVLCAYIYYIKKAANKEGLISSGNNIELEAQEPSAPPPAAVGRRGSVHDSENSFYMETGPQNCTAPNAQPPPAEGRRGSVHDSENSFYMETGPQDSAGLIIDTEQGLYETLDN